jgi:hypothetical protein
MFVPSGRPWIGADTGHDVMTGDGASLTVDGHRLSLKDVACDLFLVAGQTDHITPWEGCYLSTKVLGGKADFVLSESGHIQSLINPPGDPKARFLTNEGAHATVHGRRRRPCGQLVAALAELAERPRRRQSEGTSRSAMPPAATSSRPPEPGARRCAPGYCTATGGAPSARQRSGVPPYQRRNALVKTLCSE